MENCDNLVFVVHDQDTYAEHLKIIASTVVEFGGWYFVLSGAGPETLGDAWEWS